MNLFTPVKILAAEFCSVYTRLFSAILSVI